jgi:hypothetical protein
VSWTIYDSHHRTRARRITIAAMRHRIFCDVA